MVEVKSTQITYSNNLVTYVGENQRTNAADSDPNWIITYFQYSGSNVIKMQVSEGTWTERASLNWA
jgi:hypothetical protein